MFSEVMLAQMPFLLIGFAIFALMFFACIATFLVGKLKSPEATVKYHNSISLIFVAALLATFVYAWLTGQLKLLSALLGGGAIIEILTFGFIWVGIVWVISKAYASSKLRKLNN